jgi:hypothetical protein
MSTSMSMPTPNSSESGSRVPATSCIKAWLISSTLPNRAAGSGDRQVRTTVSSSAVASGCALDGGTGCGCGGRPVSMT